MNKKIQQLIIAAMLLPVVSAYSQDIMFQGWYWNYNFINNNKRFLPFLNDYIPALDTAGFTYVWLPPLSYGKDGTSSMGYDIQDYFDLGMYRNNRWGIRPHLNTILANMASRGMKGVGDMIYNHRIGPRNELNPAVEGWVENMTLAKINQGDQPYPSDRYYCALPLGGASGNGEGTYYIKMRSASQSPNFFGKYYTFIAYTNTVPANYGASYVAETEPNGGGDCAQNTNTVPLGRRVLAQIDGVGCKIDEFAITITAADFNPAGDVLYIRFFNSTNNAGGGVGLGDMTDHYPIGIWNGALAADVQSQLQYYTSTDFTQEASGRGDMTYLNFKPNGNPTQLGGDEDAMLFFYDVDHNYPASRDTLYEYTRWMWADVGLRGFRVDAVKHFPTSFMAGLLNYLNSQNINPGMVVGESFDYNPATLKGWVDAVTNQMNPSTRDSINLRVFDFALRGSLQQACENGGYDVRNVFTSGIVDGAGGSGFQSVTFLNNHDFRLGEPNPPVTIDPILGYAYLLTNNQIGLPSVYFTDYFSNNLTRAQINALMAVHKRYVYGSSARDYLNRIGTFYTGNYTDGSANRCLIYQLRNNPANKNVVVAINFDNGPLVVNHTINTSSISPGDTLTDIMDITGTPYLIVAPNSSIDISIPAKSFAVWVEGDLTNDLIAIDPSPIILDVQEPEMELAEFKLIPNPSSGEFTLEYDAVESGEALVQVFGMDGKQLAATRSMFVQGLNRARVDLSGFAAGVYLVKLCQQGHCMTSKAILAK